MTLMPDWVQRIAMFLPFQSMFYFPIIALPGSLSTAELLSGLGIQVLWFLLALALVKSVLAFFQGKWTETASQSVAYDLRSAIHGRLASLSFSYHDRSETGQILSRTVQDVERIALHERGLRQLAG